MNVLILSLLISSLVLVTLYRMWLNAQILRKKYDYHKPVDLKGHNFSPDEINRMNEASLFFLFCFFTLFWFTFNAAYKRTQIKSNIMMLVTLVITTLIILTIVNFNQLQ